MAKKKNKGKAQANNNAIRPASSNFKFRKAYFPIDAIAKHEDFKAWYEDGDTLFTAKSLNKKAPWSTERDRVEFISRHDAQMALIKPDNKALDYDIRVERYTYTLKTYTLYQHYRLVGMLWDVEGCAACAPPYSVYNFGYEKKDAHVRIVDEFLDKGPCFEVSVKEVVNLRIATIFLVAMLIKEEYKGASYGEDDVERNLIQKVQRSFLDKAISAEEVIASGAVPQRVLDKVEAFENRVAASRNAS